MDTQKLIEEHDVFVFGLDDVLYPEKDFLLQVYYLFSQFIEYSEQLNAEEILSFMRQTYLAEGQEGIFEKTSRQFDIPEKYQLNFELLQSNVRLPLKLLLFVPCMQFLKAIIHAQKPVYLLVSGNPEAQLNKIRQVDWQGLEQFLTVYFIEEIATTTDVYGLTYLAENHELIGKKMMMVGADPTIDTQLSPVEFNYFPVVKLNID
jgi:FMN phosphatase YigB (HAD superfamily)